MIIDNLKILSQFIYESKYLHLCRKEQNANCCIERRYRGVGGAVGVQACTLGEQREATGEAMSK
jgi:hypothetical protein